MNPSTVHNFKGEINIIKKIQFLFGQAVAEVAGRGEAKYHLFILNMLSWGVIPLAQSSWEHFCCVMFSTNVHANQNARTILVIL